MKVKIKNAKGEIFDALLVEKAYKKDMSEHFGNRKGEVIMEFVKVRRFIKSKNDYAKNATEYPLNSIVKTEDNK